MNCDEIKRKKKNINFSLLADAVGKESAEEIISQYDFKGDVIPFENAFNGSRSNLFYDLQRQFGVNTAILKSIEIRTQEYLDKYGNWIENPKEFMGELDYNGEPTLKSIIELDKGINLVSNEELSEKDKKLVKLNQTLEEESYFKIGEATESEILDMIDTGVSFASRAIYKGKLKKVELYDNLRATFKYKLKSYLESISKGEIKNESKLSEAMKVVSTLEELLVPDNFNRYIKLLDREIERLGYEELDKSEYDYGDNEQATDSILKKSWDDESKWSVPLDSSLQFGLKMHLQSIRIPILIDGVKTTEYEVNSVGFNKTYSGKLMISKLHTYFSDKKVNLDNIFTLLDNSNIPEFLELSENLKNNKKDKYRIINALVASLNRAKNDKVTILVDKDNISVYRTNNKLNRRYIINDWYSEQSTLLNKGILDVDNDGNMKFSERAIGMLKNKQKDITNILTGKDTSIVGLINLKRTLLNEIDKLDKLDIPEDEKISRLEKLIDTRATNVITPYRLRYADSLVVSTFKDTIKFINGQGFFKSKSIYDIKESLENSFKDTEAKEGDVDFVDKNRIAIAAPHVKSFLNDMGMTFELSTIEKFLSNPSKYMGDLFNGKEVYITAADLVKVRKSIGGSNVLINIIQDIEKGNVDESNSSIRIRNPLNTMAVKKVFSKLKELEETVELVDTFFNGQGKREGTFSFESNLSSTIKMLNSGELEGVHSDPFSNNCTFVASLSKDADRSVYEHFDRVDLVYLDTITNGYSDSASKFNSMSDREREVSRINLFINNESGYSNKKSIIKTHVFSDKKRVPLLILPRVESVTNGSIAVDKSSKEITNVRLKNEAIVGIGRLIMAEIDRINFVTNMPEDIKKDFSNSYLTGGKEFILFPLLNSGEFRDKFWKNNGIDKSSRDLKKYIHDYIHKLIINEANDNLKVWKDNNIVSPLGRISNVDKRYYSNLDSVYKDIKDPLYKYPIQAAHLSIDLAVNEIIANGNLMQILGDPAHYYTKGSDSFDTSKKTIEKYYKRNGSNIGSKINTSSKFEVDFDESKRIIDHSKIRYIPLRDVETSRYIEHYKEELGVYWDKSNVTDAAELTTLRDHIINLYGYGSLDDTIFNSIHRKIVESYKTGEKIKLNEEESMAIIPQKPLYAGIYIKHGVRIPLIVKSSSIPLLESLTSGSPLDELRIKMEEIEKNSILNEDNSLKNFDSTFTVRASFESAIKVGNNKSNDVFNEDFTIKEGSLDNLNYIDANRDNYGIQQEEITDESNRVSISSQANKIIHSNIAQLTDFNLNGNKYKGEEITKIKEGLKMEMISISMNKLLKAVGFEESSYKDYNKLLKFIESKAEENGINLQDLKLLRNSNGTFELPLYFNSSFNKIASLLLSEIGNRVIRPKISGKSAVQLSSIGLLFKEGSLKNDIIFTDGFKDDLKYTRYENGDLRTAQVFISRDFFEKNGFSLDDAVDIIDGKKVLNKEKAGSELLKVLALRIPNQTHSSMLSVEIVGFLPKEYKESIIASGEITKQMGSDYDIDHLFDYMYNYRVKMNSKNKVELTEEDYNKFNIEYKNAINKRVYDPKQNKVVRSKDNSNFNEKFAKIGVANSLGFYYSKKNNKLYYRGKLLGLEKITASNNKSRNLKVIENEYIDVFHSILNHPEVVKLGTRKLEYEDGTEISKYIRNIVDNKISNDYFTPLSNNYNSLEYKDNITGQDGISIQSSLSMLMIALEKGKKSIIFDKSDTKYLTFNIGGSNKIFNEIGQGKYKYKTIDDKGNEIELDRTNLITNTILQNESVDNAKNKNLGSLGYSTNSSYSFNMLNFLVSGEESLSLKFIASLLNLKGVKEAYKESSNNRDIFSTYNKYIRTIFDKFADAKYNTKKDITLSEDLVDKSLRGELDAETEIMVQNKAIKTIGFMSDYGSNLLRIYPSVNFETKGIGSNISEFLIKKKNVDKYLINNKRFKDMYTLLGNLIVSNGVKKIVPTTELGFIVDTAIKITENLWGKKINGKPLTLLGSNSFKRIVNSLENDNISNRAYRQIEKYFVDFSYLSVDNPLFIKEASPVELKKLREYLFIGDNAVYNRIQKYINNPKNSIGRNFLNNIRPLARTNINEPLLLLSKNERMSDIEIERNKREFNNMLTSTNREVRNLGLDILRAIMIQGNSYSIKGSNIFLPTDYISKVNIGKALNDFNIENVNTSKLYEQILQHDPNIANNATKYTVSKGFEDNNESYIKIKVDEAEGYEMPNYLSYRYKNKVYLMKLVSDTYLKSNNLLYERISKLGNLTSGFKEFDPFAENATSIINSNNPKISTRDAAILNKDMEVVNLIDSRYEINSNLSRFTTDVDTIDSIKFKYNIDSNDKKGLLKAIDSFSGDNKSIKEFIAELLADKDDIKFELSKTESRARGEARNNSIVIDVSAFDSFGKDSDSLFKEFEEVLPHEVLHTITMEAARNYKDVGGRLGTRLRSTNRLRESIIEAINESGGERAEELSNFFNKLNEYKKGNEVKFSSDERNKYQGLINLSEFLSEITNTKFLDSLKDIEIKGEFIVDKLPEQLVNIYEAIIEAKGLQNNKAGKKIVKAVLNTLDSFLHGESKKNVDDLKIENEKYIKNKSKESKKEASKEQDNKFSGDNSKDESRAENTNLKRDSNKDKFKPDDFEPEINKKVIKNKELNKEEDADTNTESLEGFQEDIGFEDITNAMHKADDLNSISNGKRKYSIFPKKVSNGKYRYFVKDVLTYKKATLHLKDRTLKDAINLIAENKEEVFSDFEKKAMEFISKFNEINNIDFKVLNYREYSKMKEDINLEIIDKPNGIVLAENSSIIKLINSIYNGVIDSIIDKIPNKKLKEIDEYYNEIDSYARINNIDLGTNLNKYEFISNILKNNKIVERLKTIDDLENSNLYEKVYSKIKDIIQNKEISSKALDILHSIVTKTDVEESIDYMESNIADYRAKGKSFATLNIIDKFLVREGYNPGDSEKYINDMKEKTELFSYMDLVDIAKSYC